MSAIPDDSSPASGAVKREPGLLWATAAAVAALGAWIAYDALPGINWVLWTGAAVAGLLVFSRPRGRAPGSARIMVGAPIAIAGAAAVTASPPLWALIALALVFFLAMQMLLTASPSLRSITARFAVTAPLVAVWIAMVQAMRRAAEAMHLVRSTRARAWLRGLAITLPVLVGFALLLAGADPVFAAWRDAVRNILANWEFVPRVVFFLALLVVVLGAYGYASIESGTSRAMEGKLPARWLGPTERFILLAGVAALFWLFLAIQLGYLFGNLPRIPASGMTFAEYARRGFGELSIVASASVLLIVVSERYGNDDGRERTLRVLTFAVIAAVLLLLGSAYRRVWLYEAAYGFTTARLYAQVYMYAVAVGLAMLSLEVARDFDAGRLFRRAAAAATILFIALIYWNHEAWIAGRNMDRFASTGKLDVAYLTQELSPDAIPAIVERLPSLPEPMRSDIGRAVRKQYAARNENRQRRWFEWNLASSRARQAVNTIADSVPAPTLGAQTPAGDEARYPVPPLPLPEDEEVALALSAAPPEVSSRADVYVLRGTEFVKVRSGSNACGCVVIRDLHEGSRYPICFGPEAARTVMRREMLETSLRARGKSEAEVRQEIRAALAEGTLTPPRRPSLAYMMSPRQVLFSSPEAAGVRVGAWYPHVMMTGVGLASSDLGLDSASSYGYVQAGGEAGTLHEFVVLVPVWSDGTAAPAPSTRRP